jgi:hypothetical protein
MAISSGQLNDDTKGKAVYVWHTWNDKLWDMGKGKNTPVPEPQETGHAAPEVGVVEMGGDPSDGRETREDEAKTDGELSVQLGNADTAVALDRLDEERATASAKDTLTQEGKLFLLLLNDKFLTSR